MISTESIFCNTLLVFVLAFPFSISSTTRNSRVIEVPASIWGIPLIIMAVWCMANVPIYLNSWTDRGAYAGSFLSVARYGYHFNGLNGETLFGFYTWLVSLVSSDYHDWFYITALVYVINYYIAAQRMTREYAFVLFLSMLCCFQFFAYGNNTIRAGFAGSLVMLGLSFCNRLPLMSFFFVFALFCHKSMMVPIMALLIAYNMPKKTNLFLAFWLFCIAVSLVAGSTFEGFFSKFVEGRRASYFMVDATKTIYKVGFRWDFLIYSALPVALGYYYQKVLNFKSQFYNWIYSAYLIANSFWVLVIRAAFTDRFAYLSWFLFPILLMYPLLSKQLFQEVSRQRSFVIYLLWGQFAFTYYMFLAYNGFNPF